MTVAHHNVAENNEDRSIQHVLYQIRDELRDFATTRYYMFREELKEKLTAWKTALLLLGIAMVLAIGAFFVFTYGLIALIAAVIGGAWAWAIGAACVFLLYVLVAALCGWLGYKEIKAGGIVPERTLRVLKEDQMWIKNEARSA